jgi:23S rRNA pseudouridine1911/1915/1917 synthase
MEKQVFLIDASQHVGRLDKVLSALCAELSRSRVQSLIEQGHVRINGKICESASKKLIVGDEIEVSVPPPVAAYPIAENIEIDIVYEDDDLLVVNKPAGLVVHPGAGNKQGTLVNALLHYCGKRLSGIGGVLRPGIVHRLDKDTSGLMVVAKNDQAHQGLSAQLADRSLSRLYQALVLKVPFPAKGHIEQTIGRHPTHRLKMAPNRKGGKEAKTFYRVEKSFEKACALVECKLESGRTHQIRVHMEALGHPLIGDPLYGAQDNAIASTFKKSGFEQEVIDAVLAFPRQALHAAQISFIHPVSEEEMSFSAPLPKDIDKLLKLLSNKS